MGPLAKCQLITKHLDDWRGGPCLGRAGAVMQMERPYRPLITLVMSKSLVYQQTFWPGERHTGKGFDLVVVMTRGCVMGEQ